MTKAGFTSITVPLNLHNQLKSLASQNKQSIAQFISGFLGCDCESARIHQSPYTPKVIGSNPIRPTILPQIGARGLFQDGNRCSRRLLQ